MRKKIINTCLLILVFLSSLSGAHDFSQLGNNPGSGSQAHCNTEQCNPCIPESPYCPYFEDIDPFLHQEMEPCQPRAVSLSLPVAPEALFDQGFVRSIYRPPTPFL
jgi:hypothetical protein